MKAKPGTHKKVETFCTEGGGVSSGDLNLAREFVFLVVKCDGRTGRRMEKDRAKAASHEICNDVLRGDKKSSAERGSRARCARHTTATDSRLHVRTRREFAVRLYQCTCSPSYTGARLHSTYCPSFLAGRKSECTSKR